MFSHVATNRIDIAQSIPQSVQIFHQNIEDRLRQSLSCGIYLFRLWRSFVIITFDLLVKTLLYGANIQCLQDSHCTLYVYVTWYNKKCNSYISTSHTLNLIIRLVVLCSYENKYVYILRADTVKTKQLPFFLIDKVQGLLPYVIIIRFFVFPIF